jgi:hypothetical protein
MIEVEGYEVDNAMTDGAIHDRVKRIYQSLLYFKHVMKFYSIQISGSTFLPVTKVRAYLHQFS